MPQNQEGIISLTGVETLIASVLLSHFYTEAWEFLLTHNEND